MRIATIVLSCLLLATVMPVAAQTQQADTDFRLIIPPSEDLKEPFATAAHSGARAVTGPYDLDGDGNHEILVTDYTGGGRVHVLENRGADVWEHVYSTPWADSTNTAANARYAVGADLDGNGLGEIIYVCGNGYSESNTNNVVFQGGGICVFEFTGTDDDYGDAPVFVMTFPDDNIAENDRYLVEQFEVLDVDGDGQQELLFPNNGANNRYDNWHVISVDGELASGFATQVIEARVSSRMSEDFDPVDRGGGSPYAIHAADLNGDGNYELSMHSWNSFNFTNGSVTGEDSYDFPSETSENVYLQAAADVGDHVSLFGGVVVDINNDGTEEVFYPRLHSYRMQAVSVLNYELGENPMEITEENFILDVIADLDSTVQGLTNLGITAGDIDGDGMPELIGAGWEHVAADANAGEPPFFLHVARFTGGQAGDVEDPGNYELDKIETSVEGDFSYFNVVHRDSLGETSTYYDTGARGIYFPPKVAYLGDVDGDGSFEVAASFQGVSDSIYVYDEVWNADSLRYDRTVRAEETTAAERTFVRIFSFDVTGTSREAAVVLPTDYKLSANYPNPFNPSTTFTFTLPVDKSVSVRVYDVAGRQVKTLIADQYLLQGTHEVTWDGTNDAGNTVASGTYLYSLEFGNFRQTRKMLLIK
ncbi:MAG: FlgD immunoglobulin-like domain containing protein [Rhodothermales bacterium]